MSIILSVTRTHSPVIPQMGKESRVLQLGAKRLSEKDTKRGGKVLHLLDAS